MTQLATLVLAPAAPFVVVAVVLAGAWAGRHRDLDVHRGVLLGAVVVFAIYAAPTVLTGEATFLGYGSQGDASFHFALVDRLMSDGYGLDGLATSSYEGTVRNYFDTSYPTGTHTVLGSLRPFTGTDVAWLLQPFLACLALLSALGLHALIDTRHRTAAFAVAGTAMSAGLLYAYANNQQAIKELGALVCIVAAVGIVRPLLEARPGWRSALPAAVVVGGGLGVLNLAIAPWIGPLMVVVAIVLLRRHRHHRGAVLAQVAAFAVLCAVFGARAIESATRFVEVTNVSLTGAVELGNLQRPLPFIEAFGIWPAADFRLPLPGGAATLLVGACALAAALGLVAAARRGMWPVLAFAAVSVVGFVAIAGRASPWAYAKALTLLSPVALLLAGVLALALWESRRRIEGALVAGVLLLGVAWTDAQTYHSANPAPRDRLTELADIGERFAGRGPALYPEYEEFAKHFLRDLDPSGPAEPYRRPVGFAEGEGLQFGYSYDLDDLDPASVAGFNLLVLRRGPLTSRPSAGWTRIFSGEAYDVWQRDADAPEVLEHLRLGERFDAAADAPCDAVERLADRARVAGGQLAYAPRRTVRALRVSDVPRPRNWLELPGDPEVLLQIGQGRLSGSVTTEAGPNHVWLVGSVERPITVSVDGQEVGVAEHAISQRPSQIEVGSVDLGAGAHEVRADAGGGSLAPGNGGTTRSVGPVLLTPAADPGDVPVRTVAPERWPSLCGTHVDWVEVVR